MDPAPPLDVDALDAAPRDAPTVTPAGESLRPVIDGVRTKRLVSHLDHRGRVMEIVNGDTGYWDEPVVSTYLFTVRAGQVKGWGIHETKRDGYCIVAGEMLVVMWDGRRDSPTHGLEQAVVLSPEGEQMLTIPIGVWHIDINVGPGECRVINHPTKPHGYANPDRRMLPWDSPEIPVGPAPLLPAAARRLTAATVPSPADVTAVVVALRHSPRLEACLAALRTACPEAEVLCVLAEEDLGAGDAPPGVRFLHPGMNLGWAGALHHARARITRPLMWLVQDDMTVLPGCLEALLARLAERPELVAVRPVVVDEDGIAPRGQCGMSLDEDGAQHSPIPPEPTPVEDLVLPEEPAHLPSSGLLVRLPAWDAVGGMNPWLYPVGGADAAVARRRSAEPLDDDALRAIAGAAAADTLVRLGRFAERRLATLRTAYERTVEARDWWQAQHAAADAAWREASGQDGAPMAPEERP